MAKQFVRDVLSKGRVSRGWLGVGIQELTPDLAKSLGLGDRIGIVVSQVFPKSPADKAGVKRGDVIIEFDGKPVGEAAALTRRVGLAEPDRDFDLKIARDGREMTLKVRIVERDDDGGAFERKAGGPAGDEVRKASSSLGLDLAPLSARDGEKLNLQPGQGVLVEGVAEDGAAAETGIRPGDVVMEVNRTPVASPGDFAEAVGKVKPGDSVLLLLLRGQNYFYAVVKKP
jgi:serine protease Do